MIGYSRQSVDDSDLEAVARVLKSDFLTQGPEVEAFEHALCEYTGAAHAVVVNSGSAALYVAYAAAGLKAGGRLWTSPLTFVATANAAVMLGAEVDFVDVNPSTGNLCPRALAVKLEKAAAENALPDLIVPVHLNGLSCDLSAISALAELYGISIIEDASHALGGHFAGRPVGACQYSKATTLSFHPVKSITAGEGGAVLTNDAALARLATRLRHHGIERDPEFWVRSGQPGHYYEQPDLGFNFRLSDIHAALGRSQLSRLDHFVEARKKRAHWYAEALEAPGLALPPLDADHAWHLYAIRCAEASQRDSLFSTLRSEGFGAAVHYPPVHRQLFYEKRLGRVELPKAEAYASCCLSLPLFPGLSREQVERVAVIVNEHLG